MLFRSFGLCATFALAAQSIMIPPTVGIESITDDNSIETLGAEAFKQTVKVDCPSCPIAAGDKILQWTEDLGNSFLIDFEVGQNQDTLDISGVQLYPPVFGHFANPFYITQVDSKSDKRLRLRVTGYAFHYNSGETISEAGTELLPMTFRITSIESQSVSPPALTIFILKDVSGHIMIASIKPAEAAAEASPKEQTKECKDWPLLCKWKSILADKLNGIKTSLEKGCHKTNPMRPDATGKPPHVTRPGRPHHRPQHHEGEEGRHHKHHGHGDRHRHHAFVRRIFLNIVFPVIIGIFAGAFTYLIGMAIGTCIALVWAKLRGARPGQYESVAQDEEQGNDDAKGSDKEVYCELPDYQGEAPPVYEEATEKEV
ncbi:hypothetical protein K432DRAFT_263932, partial [Lepidopterella palustris CBS 459.81]